MAFTEEQIRAMTDKERQKMVIAEQNFNCTGNGRYHSAAKKSENMVELLEGAVEIQNIRRSQEWLFGCVMEWKRRIERLPYMNDDMRSAEMSRILNDIAETDIKKHLKQD